MAMTSTHSQSWLQHVNALNDDYVSKYLRFELLSTRHGLQLLQSHLICDLNPCHLLHHLLQDQQVKTGTTQNTGMIKDLFRSRARSMSLDKGNEYSCDSLMLENVLKYGLADPALVWMHWILIFNVSVYVGAWCTTLAFSDRQPIFGSEAPKWRLLCYANFKQEQFTCIF